MGRRFRVNKTTSEDTCLVRCVLITMALSAITPVVLHGQDAEDAELDPGDEAAIVREVLSEVKQVESAPSFVVRERKDVISHRGVRTGSGDELSEQTRRAAKEWARTNEMVLRFCHSCYVDEKESLVVIGAPHRTTSDSVGMRVVVAGVSDSLRSHSTVFELDLARDSGRDDTWKVINRRILVSSSSYRSCEAVLKDPSKCKE